MIRFLLSLLAGASWSLVRSCIASLFLMGGLLGRGFLTMMFPKMCFGPAAYLLIPVFVIACKSPLGIYPILSIPVTPLWAISTSLSLVLFVRPSSLYPYPMFS